jgi:hypothetical protein
MSDDFIGLRTMHRRVTCQRQPVDLSAKRLGQSIGIVLLGRKQQLSVAKSLQTSLEPQMCIDRPGSSRTKMIGNWVIQSIINHDIEVDIRTRNI